MFGVERKWEIKKTSRAAAASTSSSSCNKSNSNEKMPTFFFFLLLKIYDFHNFNSLFLSNQLIPFYYVYPIRFSCHCIWFHGGTSVNMVKLLKSELNQLKKFEVVLMGTLLKSIATASCMCKHPMNIVNLKWVWGQGIGRPQRLHIITETSNKGDISKCKELWIFLGLDVEKRRRALEYVIWSRTW